MNCGGYNKTKKVAGENFRERERERVTCVPVCSPGVTDYYMLQSVVTVCVSGSHKLRVASPDKIWRV